MVWGCYNRFMTTQREEEQAQLILYLVKANAEGLKELAETVSKLAAAVAADHARLNQFESTLQPFGQADLDVQLAELRSEMRSRPTIRQLLVAAVSLATLAGMIGFGIAGVLV